MQVYIQHIEHLWSKAERGGHGAQLRSQLPMADSIPGLPAENGANSYCLSTLRYCCTNKFVREERSETHELPSVLHLKCLDLAKADGRLAIGYTHRPEVAGAPAREHSCHPKKLGAIRGGETAQVIYNGRHTCIDSGDWWYEQHIYNIGIAPLNPNAFTAGQAAMQHRDIACLR